MEVAILNQYLQQKKRKDDMERVGQSEGFLTTHEDSNVYGTGMLPAVESIQQSSRGLLFMSYVWAFFAAVIAIDLSWARSTKMGVTGIDKVARSILAALLGTFYIIFYIIFLRNL